MCRSETGPSCLYLGGLRQPNSLHPQIWRGSVRRAFNSAPSARSSSGGSWGLSATQRPSECTFSNNNDEHEQCRQSSQERGSRTRTPCWANGIDKTFGKRRDDALEDLEALAM
mmetsp:Transcript_25205/g.38334  ORF Transcript_25205/g.38334 Transcript_25205/m.38334 type:complete len:113 (+) Transcript_25205:297-635(+)